MSGKGTKPMSKGEERMINLMVKPMSKVNTWLYRLTGGRVGGRFAGGAPVLLLTTIGRKSAEPRTTPLLYLKEGEDVVIVASKGGVPQNPLWFRNIEANPEVEVEIGKERKKMTARRATEEEKAALWPKLVSMYKSFDDYQEKTSRDIPVLFLSPR